MAEVMSHKMLKHETVSESYISDILKNNPMPPEGDIEYR
jgi:hypothetical protein